MALRAAMSFDHIPALLNLTGGNVGAYSSYPLSLSVLTSASITMGSMGTLVDAGGTWLVSAGANSGTTYGAKAWLIPLSLLDFNTRATYVGFRFKMGIPFASTTNLNMLVIDDGVTTSGSNGAGYGLFSILLKTDFNWVTGQEYYIELKIDRIAKVFTIYIDNVQLLQRSFATTTITNKMWLGFGHTGQGVVNGGWQYQFKDITIIDDTQGVQLPDTRFGPVMGLPLTMQAADAVGYTLNGGGASVLATLTSPVTSTASTLTTPTATSPATTSPAPVDVNFAGPASGVLDPLTPIVALGFLSTFQRAAGTPSQVKYSMKDGSGNTVAFNNNTLAFDTDNQYARYPGGYPAFAPDGSAWTSAKISATTLVMQPGQLGS